jgi:YD repeat-containing protein
MNGCIDHPKEALEEYYRKVKIDGRYEIKGSYPIPSDIGEKVDCYRLLYNNKGKIVKIEHLKAGKLSEPSYFGNAVAQVLIEYYVGFKKINYLDSRGYPVKNKDLVYAKRIEHDKDKNQLLVFMLDENDALIEDNNGVTAYISNLDSAGRRVITSNFNEYGEEMENNGGIFKIFLKYDKNGNIIEERYYDINDQLKEQNEIRVAIIKRTFDEMGNKIEERYYNTENELTERKDFDIAIIKWEYDEFGNIIEERYYDKEENLGENKNLGIAMIKWDYDKNGNLVEQRYYSKDERLTKSEDLGVSIIKWKYDKSGNIIEQRYYGIDEELIEHKGLDFAIIQWEFDEKGNKIEMRYLDSNEELHELGTLGFAITRWEYDEEGNIIRTISFNKKGEIVYED